MTDTKDFWIPAYYQWEAKQGKVTRYSRDGQGSVQVKGFPATLVVQARWEDSKMEYGIRGIGFPIEYLAESVLLPRPREERKTWSELDDKMNRMLRALSSKIFERNCSVIKGYEEVSYDNGGMLDEPVKEMMQNPSFLGDLTPEQFRKLLTIKSKAQKDFSGRELGPFFSYDEFDLGDESNYPVTLYLCRGLLRGTQTAQTTGSSGTQTALGLAQVIGEFGW